MEVQDVKNALADRALDVCMHLFPNGKRSGHEWQVGDLSGAEGHSLQICIGGTKAGKWSDFAASVGGSNLLELWIKARSLEFKPALAEAKQWLGINEAAAVKRPMARVYKKPSKAGITKRAFKSEVTKYLTEERGISEAVLAEYKISETKDGQEIVFPFLDEKGEIELIKYLGLARDEKGKKKIRTSADSKKVLFGKHVYGPTDRDLLIDEGEIDALSWRTIGVKATSVPFGAKHAGKDGKDPNSEWIENDFEFLETFERIFLCFDMDEEGQLAAKSISAQLGLERCYIVKLPKKDPNECLKAGMREEMLAALKNAQTIDPEHLKNASAFTSGAEQLLYGTDAAIAGIPMPFSSVTGIFAWRLQEVTVVTGENGSGKTMWLNWLMIFFMSVNKRCFVGSFEVSSPQTLRYMISQVSGLDVPERPHTTECITWISEGLWFYDYVGQVKVPELLAAMKYARRRYGITFFVIDSLVRLGIDDDDYKAQKELLNTLTDFAKDAAAHVFLVVHNRKRDGSRDEYEITGKSGVKGSGTITDLAHNVVHIWRNKRKEKEMRELKFALQEEGADTESLQSIRTEIANKDSRVHDAVAQIQKQRNGTGEEPEYHLWFDAKARQYQTSRRPAMCHVPYQPLQISVAPSDNDGYDEAAPLPEEPGDDVKPF